MRSGTRGACPSDWGGGVRGVGWVCPRPPLDRYHLMRPAQREPRPLLCVRVEEGVVNGAGTFQSPSVGMVRGMRGTGMSPLLHETSHQVRAWGLRRHRKLTKKASTRNQDVTAQLPSYEVNIRSPGAQHSQAGLPSRSGLRPPACISERVLGPPSPCGLWRGSLRYPRRLVEPRGVEPLTP